MTTAVIVQARLGSSRLPGKVLRPLGAGAGGRTVLAEVLRRCHAVAGADLVCCAIPEGAEDDAVAAEAERAGAVVWRGDETDVLDRYRGAARRVDASVVLRVTSDCPLIDPELCGEVLALRADRRADYASNNQPPGFPHGLDCEAFTAGALERAWKCAVAPDEREHVTPWLRTADGVRRAALSGPDAGLERQRWTLDYEEDHAFLCAVFDRLSAPQSIPPWRTVAELVASDSDLGSINAMHGVR